MESEPDEINLKIKSRLLLEAVHIQELQLPISYVDKDILYRSVNVLQTYSITNLKAWIRNALHIVNTYRIENRNDQNDVRKRTRYKLFEGNSNLGEEE